MCATGRYLEPRAAYGNDKECLSQLTAVIIEIDQLIEAYISLVSPNLATG